MTVQAKWAAFNDKVEWAVATWINAVRWITPGTAVAAKAEVGQVHFRMGWFGSRITEAVYFTPLGEIPHSIPEMTAYTILKHADDWVDALVIVHQEQECGC